MKSNARQLVLDFGIAPRPLPLTEGALQRELKRPVRLVFTNNRSTMLSARPKGRVLEVRAHRMFERVDDEVFSSLVLFLNGRRDPRRAVDRFIAEHQTEIAPRRRRRPSPESLCVQGRHHDLMPLLERLVETYFVGIEPPLIGWGRRPRRRGRSLRLGSYDPELHLIRVHPRLDQPFVPGYVVEVLVYHELCHAYLAVTEGKEAGLRHDDRFRTLERAHPDYARAQIWERGNLHRL